MFENLTLDLKKKHPCSVYFVQTQEVLHSNIIQRPPKLTVIFLQKYNDGLKWVNFIFYSMANPYVHTVLALAAATSCALCFYMYGITIF